jgi:hypothetical protein
MVAVQSTWFPVIDRNPQKFVENIFKAKDTDFQPARMRVHRSPQSPSHISLQLLKTAPRENAAPRSGIPRLEDSPWALLNSHSWLQNPTVSMSP